MAYQKPPAEKPKKSVGEDVVTVTIEDTGTKIDQKRMIGVYKAAGYGHAGVDEDGSVLMAIDRKKAEALKKREKEEARERLIRTQEADKAEFGNALVRSGATLTRESAQTAYEQSVEIDSKLGFADPSKNPRNADDNFDEQ